MNGKDSQNNREEIEKKSLIQSNLTKRVATSAIFIAVGIVLAMFNPFAFVEILGGPKVFPMAHFINGITDFRGLTISCQIFSMAIAIFRYPVGIGSIHAFHGGISGALVVGLTSYIIRKKKPNYIEYAALTEPIGTVFIGATIASIVTPGAHFLWWWVVFASASIPGSILGFLMLKLLKRQGVSYKDFFQE